MKSKIPWLVSATALIGSIVLTAIYWPQLPEKMASHFNAGGQPDGWMNKGSFVGLMVLIQFGLAAMMFGIGRLTRVLPPSMINVPNREYWLADERREQTLQDSESMLAWIAAGTSVFLMVIFWLTFDANIGEDQQLNSTISWIALAVYLLGLFGFCFVKLAKYYRIPAESQNRQL